MTIHIYALIDPIDNKVKYVGATNNIESRLKGHISSGKIATHAIRRGKRVDVKTQWLHDLHQQGLIPLMKILDSCQIEQAQERERYYFEIYNKLFHLLCLHPDKKPYVHLSQI